MNHIHFETIQSKGRYYKLGFRINMVLIFVSGKILRAYNLFCLQPLAYTTASSGKEMRNLLCRQASIGNV